MLPSDRRRPSGTAGVWLAGSALAVSLLAIVGLLALLGWRAWNHFRPKPIVEVGLAAGTEFPGVRLRGNTVLGEVWAREPMPQSTTGEPVAYRVKLRLGNRELYRNDFAWLPETAMVEHRVPIDVVRLERRADGPCFGRLVAIEAADGTRIVQGASEVAAALAPLMQKKAELAARLDHLTQRQIGDINHEMERLRLRQRGLERRGDAEAARALDSERSELEERFVVLAREVDAVRADLQAESLVLATGDGQELKTCVGDVLSLLRPNALGVWDTLGVYAARVSEFVFGAPRESNTEGGIFPAIFGTVLMVFLMTIFVTPLGVLAALYLREYSRQGRLVQLVRIAVNNLAGVPSIVFGVFGFGFFVYLVGGTIDEWFYADALPRHTFGTGGILWAALTLALLTVPVVIVATEEGLAAVPRIAREGSLALGATKWETTRKVVLPAAAPAILTGVILAIARAAGEVAPLMIVGMVKLADLPLDHHFPYLHVDRKFMHLGFHIYDVGFQSPDVEATQPLVYATAFLLVGLVFAMNLLAISVRNRLRRRTASAH